MKKKLLFVSSFISMFGFSQWNPNPAINTSVSIQPNDQQDVKVISDAKGGAIITWLDFRSDVTQTAGDIFAQRIDKNGFVKWTVNGVAICTLPSDQAAPAIKEDGHSGAFLVWNDWRNGTRDIYAQRIDSSGNIMWAANGLPVIVKSSHQQDAKLVSDGSGGIIIVWQDSTALGFDIYAQRLNGNGIPQWNASGVAICTASGSQINPKMESDGAGGAIIVWQDKRNGVDYDIYAQRINAAGIVQWTTNGVFICSMANTTQSNPKLRADGSGGAIIAWQDKRNGIDYDIYAQRVNASGVVQWALNGIPVCTATGNQSAIDMTNEGINGVIVAWKDQRAGNTDIYAQKIDLAGTTQWAVNGIAITTNSAPQLNPNVVGDGNGGAIIVWQDSSAGNWNIKSQRVDGNGNNIWTAGGVDVGIASGNQTSPHNISDGNGGSIYAWQDKRNGNFDVYAHHLYANGTTNGIFENENLIISNCFPNPFIQKTFIQIGNFSLFAHVELKIYDLYGKEVDMNPYRKENGFEIKRNNSPSGIYFYQITFDKKNCAIGKIIITD